MPNLRPIEILLIVLVVLLLFGARRLPDLARSVGSSLKIFKSEVKDLRDDDRPQALPELTHTPEGADPDVASEHRRTAAAPLPGDVRTTASSDRGQV